MLSMPCAQRRVSQKVTAEAAVDRGAMQLLAGALTKPAKHPVEICATLRQLNRVPEDRTVPQPRSMTVLPSNSLYTLSTCYQRHIEAQAHGSEATAIALPPCHSCQVQAPPKSLGASPLESAPYRKEHSGGNIGSCRVLLEGDLRATEGLNALQRCVVLLGKGATHIDLGQSHPSKECHQADTCIAAWSSLSFMLHSRREQGITPWAPCSSALRPTLRCWTLRYTLEAGHERSLYVRSDPDTLHRNAQAGMRQSVLGSSGPSLRDLPSDTSRS